MGAVPPLTVDAEDAAEEDIVNVVELPGAQDDEQVPADEGLGSDNVALVVEHCREIGVATDEPWPGGWPGQIELALIDAVLSIRAQYGSPTTGVRRCVRNWRRHRDATCDDLSLLASMDGAELASVLDNRQRLGGGPLKAEAIVAAAANLTEAEVRHASDLASPSPAHKRAYGICQGV